MTKKYFLAILIIVFIFFAPFLAAPSKLTGKDNDLGRTYVPIYEDVKTSFSNDKQIPLWSSRQMMGEPLVGNPLPALFYPANILFLIFPVKLAAVLYLFLHFLLAAVSTFFLARTFKLSKDSSLAAAVFYAFSTKVLVHTTAGHLTMVAAFAYFPLLFLSTVNAQRTKSIKWIILIALSFAFLFLTHLTIFYYSLLFIFAYAAYKAFKNFTAVIIGFMLGLGLSAISFVPLLEFNSFSNRTALKLEEVALPLWSLKRFLTSLIFPYLNFKSLDHESFLYLGLVPSILFIFGFMKLKKIQKAAVAAGVVLVLLFAAGLSMPVFKIAYEIMPFLQFSRITTRPWFIVALIVALIAAYGLEKPKKKALAYLLVLFFLTEVTFIFYKKLSSVPNLDFSNRSLYEYLANDRNLFRVYCTTYCFNPQILSQERIELLGGETPIQNGNFVNFLQKAGNYTFDNFAVIFPPYQTWQVENPPIPDSKLLGLANVKYVASTYEIKDSNFEFIDQFENIFLYKNQDFKNRAYFEDSDEKVTVERYWSNYQKITFSKSPLERRLIIAENYYPGLFVKIDNQRFEVRRKDEIFRQVEIPPNTQSVEVIYDPKSLMVGKTITFGTSVLIAMLYIRKRKTWQK